MECLICKDSGNEPLRNSTNCTCKYQCHDSCWIEYVHSQRKLKCPMCRRVLNSVPKTKSALFSSYQRLSNMFDPSAPPSEPYSSQGRELGYEEFRDVLGFTNTHQTTPQNNNRRKKFSEMNTGEKVKFAGGVLCIVAIVVISIVIIATVL